MSVFEAAEFDQHEEVVFINEPEAGLRAVIAIHSTTLGPALGGCRMWAYERESDAIRDVLRLSRGMTHKAAILDCGLGGGKSVIIGDPYTQKTPQMLHAMGRWIASLGERYIVGEDIGTNPADMKEIRTETRCVSCLRQEDGGYGDPAPMTALGVFSAMRAGIEHTLGSGDFDGLRVAVQGAGNVGSNLCRLLHDAGAKLVIADVNADNLRQAHEEFAATEVAPADLLFSDVDVLAPCALGNILTSVTIPKLKAKIVAGAANNQLANEADGTRLAERDILYAPDYVINAGGIINVAHEYYGHSSEEQVRADVGKIPQRLDAIFAEAKTTAQPTNVIADNLARRLVASNPHGQL